VLGDLNQSQRISYQGYYNPDTNQIILTGSPKPQPVGGSGFGDDPLIKDGGIFYETTRITSGPNAGAFLEKPVSVAQTEQLVLQLTGNKDAAYQGAGITFVGEGSVGLAFSASSYELRNAEAPVKVDATVTLNSWLGRWTKDGATDTEVLDVRTPQPATSDPVGAIAATSSAQSEMGWQPGAVTVRAYTGSALAAYAATDTAAQLTIDSAKNYLSQRAGEAIGWIAGKLVELGVDTAKPYAVDSLAAGAANLVDSPARINARLNWQADLQPADALRVIREGITQPQWNVINGKSPSGFEVGSTNYINAGDPQTAGVDSQAEKRIPAVQVTTYRDETTDAIMEVRLSGTLVNGQFVADTSDAFVAGFDTQGRYVLTGETAAKIANAQLGIPDALGANTSPAAPGSFSTLPSVEVRDNAPSYSSVSIQDHGNGATSLEFVGTDGTRAWALSNSATGGRTVVISIPGTEAEAPKTIVRDFDQSGKKLGEQVFDQSVQIDQLLGLLQSQLGNTFGASDLTSAQAEKLLSDMGLKPIATSSPITLASSGDGIQTDGGLITGYADAQASNQGSDSAQCARPAINTEANTNSFGAYLQGQGADLSPAQQDALAIQLDGLNLGGAADLGFHSLPGGGVLISNADGDIVGEINRNANGDINLRANSISPDGAAGQTSTHITSSGQTFNDSQYTEAQLRGVTQGLSLLNSLAGLQHWEHMGDLQRVSALLGLYSTVDRLSGDALPGGLGELGEAAAVLNLAASLQSGNVMGTLSGINTLSSGAIDGALNAALGSSGIPYLSVIGALESGNPTSMLAAAANFIPGYGPLISIGLSLFGSGGGLFGAGATPPPPYGEVHFAWSGFDANGQPHTAVRTDANVSGGAATASQIAQQVLNSLQTMLEQANARTLQDHPDTDPSQLLALNTNLLPSVFWDKDQTSLKLPNPDGATSFFVNLADGDAMARVVELLQSNGGIGPKWLVDTQSQRYAQLLSEGAGEAAIERELTAGKSGLTEQGWSQAAAIQGGAGEAADFKTQQFGSLVVHAQDAQVQLTEALKNIDADAYLERTEWVAANDAQGNAQSLLIIDFNNDGVVDTRDVLNLGGNRGQTDARDAQALNANADLQRNNVQWLDANGDGVLDARDPAFAAVRLFMDINADARLQDGEARSLAQAGITAIDFTAGQVRYADGHSDALTAQMLTGDTSGAKLTKVYQVVDGQHIDLQAGDVLENEGYLGQDASGAIRQQTFAHEAVRTGDWEGTAEQDDHRHGGTNVTEAPTETTASGAVSQGAFLTQAQTAFQRTVTASQVRQTQTAERLAFVPTTALSGVALGSLADAQLVTAEMVQSMEDGLLGGGGLNLGLLSVLAAGATQAAAQAAEAQSQVAANAPAGQLSDNGATAVSLSMDGAGMGLAYTLTMGSDGGVVGMSSTQSPVPFISAGPALAPIIMAGAEGPVVVVSEAAGTTVASTAASPVPPRQTQATVTSVPLGATPSGNPPNSQTVVPAATVSPTDAASAPVQGMPTTVMFDYPVVHGEIVSGSEDVAFRIAGALLVSNDSTVNTPANPSAPALTVTAVGNAVHGQVALIGDEVVFVPEANFYGTASFTYAATDQYGLSRSATAVLQIAAVNDAPTVTGGEEIDSEEDQTLIIQAAGLLQNDVDVDSPHEELVLSRVQSGTGGMVNLDANGDVVFTPDQDFFGNAVFTYWVRDGAGAESSPVTATVVVAPVNDAPGAQGEVVSGASEDAVFNIAKTTLLANDVDVDDPNSALSLGWVGDATGGTVSLDANGDVVFTPAANFNGYASFSYKVRDAAGLESPVVLATIPVAAVNDAPLAVDDQFSTYRNSTMSIGFAQLTGNDSDVDADALTVSGVRNGVNGEVALVDGKVQFVPTSGFTGAASFDYLADDGQGGQTWATAFVNVIVPPLYPTVNVTLGSYWIDVWHNDAANLRQTFNYSFNDENPATVAMDIVPNFGAGFTYAGFGNVQWVTAHDFNIFKYDRYGAANISLNLNLTDESGLTNVAHVYTTYHTAITVTSVFDNFTEVWNYSMSLDASLTSFSVWHDHTGYATPVVLDLDGRGLQAVETRDSGVAFDVDEDGLVDRMAWVGAGNGVLALDIDGDGRIGSAKEFAFRQYVEGAQTDLEGLAAFDTNHDARLDANDALFAGFGVWQDKNADGIQEAGEYQTLAQLGIASIDLRSDGQVQTYGGEVVSFGRAQFTRNDGSTGAAYDTALAYQSGTEQAKATLCAAAMEAAAVAPIADAAPATCINADSPDANAIQMALLFNQMCNTAGVDAGVALGFAPLETAASGQEWVDAANAAVQQLQAA